MLMRKPARHPYSLQRSRAECSSAPWPRPLLTLQEMQTTDLGRREQKLRRYCSAVLLCVRADLRIVFALR